jgi:hypothetical protein
MIIINYECGCVKSYKYKKDIIVNNCVDCNILLCDKHAYYYIDGNNTSITKNGKCRCLDCYKKRFGSK